MLEQLTKTLTEKGAFDPTLPPILTELTKTISNPIIPDKMKTVIAISEVTTFASQFRRNMWHWEGFELPCNSISFIIAGSGDGKDSSVKAVRRSFAAAYALVDKEREAYAKKRAIELADEAGCADPSNYEEYKEFYERPAPIYIAPTTPQGFIQHINDIGDCPIGSGTMYAGEFGDELATNGHMSELIKTIAETYDTGDKEVVYTKGKDHRSKEISSMPLSALFVSSENYLVYDESVKKKFLLAFGSKLARRAYFCYANKMLPQPSYDSVEAMIEAEEQAVAFSNKAKEAISKEATRIAEYNLAKHRELLSIDRSVFILFSTYKRYNNDISEKVDPRFPLSKLVRKHLQWKALKLAGAFAIFKCQDTVTEEDFIEAIRVCELLDRDMAAFEAQLVKEPYETFCDYMKSISVEGKSEISLHNLRKMKYIPTSGDPTKKMKELIHLASSYDKEALYSVQDTFIHYEGIQKTDVLNISFKPIDIESLTKALESNADKSVIDTCKRNIAAGCSYGLEVAETTFPELAELLQGSFCYSPFRFENGQRNKESLINGTKWLVLDIDDSKVTASEADFMLSDVNHHIALSSDPSNEFKFRVLIELDSVVELSPILWRNFYLAIAADLGLKVDPLPQSQIFYSYAGRQIYSVIDAEPLPVRDYIVAANEALASSGKDTTTLTSPQKQALLNDPLTTFAQAFEAKSGEGSRKLIWAARYAYYDLGATKEETLNLIDKINNYWLHPMPEERLDHTILQQIRRW